MAAALAAGLLAATPAIAAEGRASGRSRTRTAARPEAAKKKARPPAPAEVAPPPAAAATPAPAAPAPAPAAAEQVLPAAAASAPTPGTLTPASATQAAPAPPPEPRPAPPAAPPPAPSSGGAASSSDLERLRAEHGALRDALFRSRSRREILEGALFSTQLAAVIRWEAGRRFLVKQAELRIDGVRIWEAGDGALGDRPVDLAARGTPPGPHVLAVRLEVRARENPKLGYVSEQSFSVTLAEGKKTTVTLTIDDDGDLPSYNPDIELELDVAD